MKETFSGYYSVCCNWEQNGGMVLAYIVEPCLPTAEQWMALRASMGWATFPPEVAEKSLNATWYCVCAFDGDKLIGMGRVLGDGVISFYIGNVMVLPSYQNEGVGKRIIERILAHVERNAAPGAIASLFSIKGKEGFYGQLGFEPRPDDTRGPGMSRYF